MTYYQIINYLKSLANPKNVAGMARFGIYTQDALGVPLDDLRKLAKQIGKNHILALQLWDSGIHEAYYLACSIDNPKEVTEAQMERWVKTFNSWDTCDNCCGALLDKTPFAYQKAVEWSSREEEFVKRAGFTLMAWLAVHDKKAQDDVFLKFLPLIKQQANDERIYVKKAVNWALRGIGKKNKDLNRAALKTAEEIKQLGTKSARWIASDALRELNSEAVQARVNRAK